jgi:hypothetical protein
MKVCVHVLIEQPRTYCVHGCSIPDFIPLVLIEQTCTQYVHGASTPVHAAKKSHVLRACFFL